MKTDDEIRDIASHTERTTGLDDGEAIRVGLALLRRAGATVTFGPQVGRVDVQLLDSHWNDARTGKPGG